MNPFDPHFYRENELCRMFGVTRTTLTRWRKKECFPDPIVIGARTRIWPVNVIDDWLQSRPGAEKQDLRRKSPE